MKVYIILNPFLGWRGGIEFLLALISSLKAAQPDKHQLMLVYYVNPKHFFRTLSKSKAASFHPGLAELRNLLSDLPRSHRQELLSIELRLPHPLCFSFPRSSLVGPFPFHHRFLRFFPSGLRLLTYIPDFQHIEIPQNFSRNEIESRNSQFNAVISRSHLIMTHSIHSLGIMNRLFDIPKKTTAFSIGPYWSLTRRNFQKSSEIIDEVRMKYGLDGKYFVCSNQFWKHKNHSVVLEAVKISLNAGMPMKVCFTGEMSDYRGSSHIQQLFDFVETEGIQNYVTFTGFVNKAQQLALIRGATALIQPTLYEGSPGGNSVFESLSLGVPVILSSLPVTEELDSPICVKFNPNDPYDLYRVMAGLSSSSTDSPLVANYAHILSKRKLHGQFLWSKLAGAQGELALKPPLAD